MLLQLGTQLVGFLFQGLRLGSPPIARTTQIPHFGAESLEPLLQRLVLRLPEISAFLERPREYPPGAAIRGGFFRPVGWGTGARTLGSGGNSTHFYVGLSPAPMATFPAAPPKIPYGGFSPVRLQVPGTAQFSRESSRVGRWLKWDPHIRHLPSQLALAFGIASAGRDPTSMCGASASDDSTWTQRSSLR